MTYHRPKGVRWRKPDLGRPYEVRIDPSQWQSDLYDPLVVVPPVTALEQDPTRMEVLGFVLLLVLCLSAAAASFAIFFHFVMETLHAVLR